MKKKLLFIIVIGIFFNSLPAQERLRCNQISLEQGLSQTSVYVMVQDKLGFIWIGTESGLNRFDGYQFRVYTEDRLNPQGICNSYVWSMLIDSAGDLWVGTDGGLCKYVSETDSFISYLHDPQKSDSLSDNRVFAIHEDRTKNLWVGTDGGLNRLDRQTGKFTRYQSDSRDITSLSSNLVRAIFQDHDGSLWVGTEGGGLNRLNPQTGKFDHFRHQAGNIGTISNDNVVALYEDREGTLWIGTRAGLDRLDAARSRYTHYRQQAGDPLALSNDWINCIYADRSGRLWFGTNEGGVCQYLPKKNGFISFRHDPDDATSLGQDRILSMIEDYSGNLWFGTYAAGLSKYNKNVAKFRLFRQERNNPNSLSNSMVRGIYKESQNILLVATDGGGLNRIDRASGKYTVYMKNPADPRSISSNRPFSILRDREGTFWVTTADGGLNKFDPQTGKFTAYMNDPGNPNSIGNNFVRPVVEDREGYLWLGLDGGGLNRFDKRTGTCKRYMPQAGNPNSLSFYRVFALYYDKADILWIGTYGGGLNRFDPKTESFKIYRYTPSMTVPEKMLDNYVLSLIEDKRGNLWLGTSNGLTRFSRDKETFRTFLVKDGLPDNVIYAIVEDNDGNLWLTTNRGLSRFNPLTEKFKNFDINDGLQSYEYSTYSYCKGDDGELFFGGVNGFNSFYPEQIVDNAHVPAIVLTRFQLFNNDVPIGKKVGRQVLLSKAIGSTSQISLSYKQNVFSFEFAALDYLAPEKNQYAYFMENLDKNWNYVGNRRFVAYAGIPPGKYVFRVKGSNNDGLWNNAGVSVAIDIQPPFWQTGLFRIFMLILIVGLIFLFLQRRMRRLNIQKTTLEKLVKKRTRDLNTKTIELQKHAAQATLLYKISQRVSSELKLDVLLTEIVTSILETFNYYGVMLLLLDEKEKHLTLKSIAGGYKGVFPDDLHLAMGEGMIGKAAQTRQTQVSGDVTKNPDYVMKAREVTKAELSIPIVKGAKVIGVLDMQSTEIDAFTESDITAMETLSTQIASAIENAYLFELAGKAKAAAEAASQAKGMFLSRMSHEIRTPMNSVIGFSDMLLDTQMSEEQVEFVRNITKSGEALLSLINEILDFSKIEAGQMTFQSIDFDLEITAFDVCHITQPRLGNKPVEVLCRVDDNLPAFINSDPTRMRQVLLNLISNAIKFTSEGEIELYIKIDEESDTQLKLHTTVRDTGIGIPADKLETVFELFQQVDGSITRKFGGTGLGLAICRQIARLMKGEVWVESALGKGSTFHFIAWVNKSEKVFVRQPQVEALAGKKALLVDDYESNLDVLAHVVQLAGMRSESVRRGDAVLPLLQKALAEKDPFDICILDIQMPDMSGYEVSKQLRTQKEASIANLKLLAFSSSVTKRIKMFKESGFDGFLPKPIHRHTLITMLKRLLGEVSEETEPQTTIEKAVVITQHTLAEEAKHSVRILLAEDNPMNQKLAQFMLTKAGYQLEVANNGREAVEKYTADPERYDLIFMDVHMPEIDGLEATKVLRNRGYKEIPIIAMTADAMKEDRDKCLESGMNDYMAKPIRREEVFAMIKKWVFRE